MSAIRELIVWVRTSTASKLPRSHRLADAAEAELKGLTVNLRNAYEAQEAFLKPEEREAAVVTELEGMLGKPK